jgi:hypothetical protein
MAWAARAVEAVGVQLDETADAVDDVAFSGKGLAIMREHVEERPA